MKKLLKILGVLVGLAILAVIMIALLTPWMDRWGATDAEIAATFPGDELVPEPASFINRAITVNAAPEFIYPWIVQLDATKGGWYSYTWLESLIGCKMVNADRIHPEWQNLQVGDLVRMCPDEPAPPPYTVAQIHPDQAIVMGHQEDGEWVDLYQFVIVPQADGTSRLILRTRTQLTGGFWTIFHSGFFIMERGLLRGIRERAESLAQSGYEPPKIESVSTPEVFNPLDPAPTAAESDLPLTCQVTDLNVYIDRAAGYCFAYPSDFTLGEHSSDYPDVLGPPRGSPVEPIRATFTVVVTSLMAEQSLDQQAEAFLRDFTVMDPNSLTQTRISIGGEEALQVDAVPVQLSWQIIFVPHSGNLYRLMFWPVDVSEVQPDVSALRQTVLGSFAFID
ncbi:MAG: hypothetical protein ACK2T5_11850 [Anaerolineales bacterium]